MKKRTNEEMIAFRKSHFLPTASLYHKEPLHLTKAQGQFVWDSNGKKYLDAIGGRGSTLAQFGPTEADRAKQEAAYDSLQQQMEELRAVGEEVGRTFAAAFESVVSGASSARDAVAGLARQLGSQVLQSAFAKFGGQIAGSFARSGEPPTRQRAPGES